jgi:glycosyltransferase involved in cell wall biosynthesis
MPKLQDLSYNSIKSNYKRIYFVKALNRWLIDDLYIFNNASDFSLLLLRNPQEFLKRDINILLKSKLNILVKPFRYKINLSEIWFVLVFFVSNINKFYGWYNFVVGVKSLIWFLLIDKRVFLKTESIHCEFATQTILISILINKYFQRDISLYYTVHAHDIFFKNKWLSYISRNTEKCFTISKYNKNYLADHYKITNKHIKVIYAGVNISENQNTIQNDNSYRIGFLSNLIKKKGIKYLLEAFVQFLQVNENARLIIAGSGPLKNEIEEYIIQEKLSDNVLMLGRIDENEKINFFKSIDVFVLPSTSEKNDMDGIPKVLREAVNFNVPIISTNISGIPEICIDRVTGILVNEKSVNDILYALNRIKNDDELLMSIEKNGKRFLKSKFDNFDNIKLKLKSMGWMYNLL